MTYDEAQKIKESLTELEATAEKFDWGPSQELAKERQKEAIQIINREMKNMVRNNQKSI